ncbi:MAG: tRNA guanosine(15) transglycosylase TgtA [Thermoproteota archaeon]|jgi:tRNA-guanine transglycosylases, various specificities
MSFEIIDKTLLARIGKLYTKKGFIETPALFPVISVNPKSEIINWLKELGCKAVITNAYLLWKKFRGKKINIHEYFSFPYPIMTDSGGYQILKYGEVSITPLKSLKYQISISSDICTILDYPTGLTSDFNKAKRSVSLTIRRAKIARKFLESSSSLIVAPIQGGFNYNLLKKCATEMKKLDYPIYAIGSPTGLMEKYEYSKVLKMILVVKSILGPQYPIHLFGAGHPMFFPFIVALGIDSFDSAAYSIYAKDDRYLTRTRTYRLEDMDYLPCNCEVCRKWDVQELKRLNKEDRILLLEKHNLYVSIEEIKNIKLHIKEGTLWNYLQEKSRVHPSLFEAFLLIKNNIEDLIRYHPISKAEVRGIFFFDKLSSIHPDVIMYHKKLSNNFRFSGKTLILLPFTNTKPFIRSREIKLLCNLLNQKLERNLLENIEIAMYGYPFILVPLELSETFPNAQWEGNLTSSYVTKITKNSISTILKLNDLSNVLIFYDKRFDSLIKFLSSLIEIKGINPLILNINKNLLRFIRENSQLIIDELKGKI